MPTFIDNDDVSHEAVIVDDDSIRFSCELAAAASGQWQHVIHGRLGKLHPNQEKPVTCFACLAEVPPPLKSKDFMTCDLCGDWWVEENERLVSVSKEYIDNLESYRVLQQGTLPECPRCGQR